MILLARRISSAPREADSMGEGVAQQSINGRGVAVFGLKVDFHAQSQRIDRYFAFGDFPSAIPCGYCTSTGVKNVVRFRTLTQSLCQPIVQFCETVTFKQHAT